MAPSTWGQLGLFVAAILPGFVFQGVRARICGDAKQNADLSTRLTRALAISVLLDCLYLLAFGASLARSFGATSGSLSRSTDPRALALLLLGLVFALPALLAWMYSYRGSVARWYAKRIRSTKQKRLARRAHWLAIADRTRVVRRGPRESTWDDAVSKVTEREGFVRVRKPDGSWVGGRFSTRSGFSEFPDDPSLFLDEGWIMSDIGEFVRPENGSRGSWILCNDAMVVEFIGTEEEVPTQVRHHEA